MRSVLIIFAAMTLVGCAHSVKFAPGIDIASATAVAVRTANQRGWEHAVATGYTQTTVPSKGELWIIFVEDHGMTLTRNAKVYIGGDGAVIEFVESKSRDDRRAEIQSSILEYWVRQNQDRKVFRYVEPELCAWLVVAKLRREAFVIYPKTDPRPPRNSWDTDESRTWYDLDIGEIKIDGGEATAHVTTRWGAGFHVQEYSLRWDSGRWFVARAQTLIVT